jgi:beta-glucosidase-like glycosyl hydrolase/CubicO group peptidase (beta-lactamase class C family)
MYFLNGFARGIKYICFMTNGRIIITLTVLFLGLGILGSNAQAVNANSRQKWVDSIYNQLSQNERIGQLFMVAAYSGGKDYNEEKIKKLIAARQIGGLIFMQGTPEAQAEQTNNYQRMAQVPLMIGMDAEWGLGMRLTGVKDFPRQMMIGATRDTAIAYALGKAVAEQCKRLGVHINFAPVVDVNNNPNNPIINARSFGEDKNWVARLGIAYMKGMQDNGVMACGKHFPGHGDTDVDSHKDLPTIRKSLKQLDTLELYPFKELVRAGIKSMMVAHLEVPALDTEPHTPTTLSKNTITELLKNRLAFKGLVFTDALNMDGVAKYYKPGEVDLKAFVAGNDVLLFSQDVPTAIAKISDAISRGQITQAELEARVKKILSAKYDLGLANWKPVEVRNATADLNKDAIPLKARTARAAVTLVRDRNDILNKILKEDARIGYLGINASSGTTLYQQLNADLPNMKVSWLPKGSSEAVTKRALDAMLNNDVTVVAVHNLTFYPSGGNHGLDANQISVLKRLQNRKDVIIVMMGNAYLLKNICDVSSTIVAYEDDSVTQAAVANVLLKNEIPVGILPVTPCKGMKTMPPPAIAKAGTSSGRLTKVDFVQDAGVVKPEALSDLNLFMQRSVANKVFPGARVLAAKNGKIFYDESFGYYTYDKTTRVTENTLYDVASLTKVLSTTLAVMRLYETGKLNLDKRIGDYLTWTQGTDKANLRVRDLLLHQAGLKAWIPFYQATLDEKKNLRADLYSRTRTTRNNIEVANDLYLRNDYVDTIWSTILNSPLENKGKSVYSDLDFYFLAAIAEQITGKTIDVYVEEQFYKPMGLKSISYNPLKEFSTAEIAPTENDQTFRKQLVHGYVHDPGAALFGGLAGHAGIFATAHDVAAIFQLLLSGGTYNGKRIFKKETVDYFTAYSSRISRRALGFDKPSAERDDAGPAGERTTGYAFGHQGFTGTCAWADPATGVVFVFLSNRVNPSAENNAINKQSVRTKAQDYIYEALGYPVNRSRPEIYRQQTTGK